MTSARLILTPFIMFLGLASAASAQNPSHAWPTPARSRHLEPVAKKKQPEIIKKKTATLPKPIQKPKRVAKKSQTPARRPLVSRTSPRVMPRMAPVRAPAQISSPTAYSASPPSVYTVPTHVIRLAQPKEPVESMKLEMKGKEIN